MAKLFLAVKPLVCSAVIPISNYRHKQVPLVKAINYTKFSHVLSEVGAVSHGNRINWSRLLAQGNYRLENLQELLTITLF